MPKIGVIDAPEAEVKRLERMILRIKRAAWKILRDEVLPAYQREEAERSDSLAPIVKNALGKMRDKMRLAYPEDEIAKDVESVARSTDSRHRRASHGEYERALGVKLDLLEGDRTAVSDWGKENVGLIKSIVEDIHPAIEQEVTDAFARGLSHKDLAKKWRKKGLPLRFGTLEGRAKVIARDQVSKLNGRLTRERQSGLGLTRYIWRTSGDSRVRDRHRALNGKEFRWDSPPSEGHPGEAVNCRCTAEAVIDLDEISSRAPAESPPEVPKIVPAPKASVRRSVIRRRAAKLAKRRRRVVRAAKRSERRARARAEAEAEAAKVEARARAEAEAKREAEAKAAREAKARKAAEKRAKAAEARAKAKAEAEKKAEAERVAAKKAKLAAEAKAKAAAKAEAKARAKAREEAEAARAAARAAAEAKRVAAARKAEEEARAASELSRRRAEIDARARAKEAKRRAEEEARAKAEAAEAKAAAKARAEEVKRAKAAEAKAKAAKAKAARDAKAAAATAARRAKAEAEAAARAAAEAKVAREAKAKAEAAAKAEAKAKAKAAAKAKEDRRAKAEAEKLAKAAAAEAKRTRVVVEPDVAAEIDNPDGDIMNSVMALNESRLERVKKRASRGDDEAALTLRVVEALESDGYPAHIAARRRHPLVVHDGETTISHDLRIFGDGGIVDEDSEVVWVSPAKIDKAWTRGRIERDGSGEIGDRRAEFSDFLATGTPIQPSQINVARDGSVEFTNGRHRFSHFREMGVSRVPMLVSPDEAKKLREIAGADPP